MRYTKKNIQTLFISFSFDWFLSIYTFIILVKEYLINVEILNEQGKIFDFDTLKNVSSEAL